MITSQLNTSITDLDKSFYTENGFLVLKNVFSAQEIEALNIEYDRLFDQKIGWDQGNFFDLGGNEETESLKMPQLLNPSRYSEVIRNSNIYETCKQIALKLMGLKDTDKMNTTDHAILKPFKNSVPTPWHQDEAYWSTDGDRNDCSFWIPLHDVDYKRGCMCFIPKSHKIGIVEHQHIDNDPRVHGLEALNIDDSNKTICPLSIGSATVHHCKTLHFTPENTSGLPRKALIIVCNGPSIKLTTPRIFSWQNDTKTKRQGRAEKSLETDKTKS